MEQIVEQCAVIASVPRGWLGLQGRCRPFGGEEEGQGPGLPRTQGEPWCFVPYDTCHLKVIRRPRPSSCVKRLSRTQHHPLKSLRSLATRWNSCMAYRTCLSRTSMISAMTYSMYHAYCSRMPVSWGRHSNMILPLPRRTVWRPPVYLYNTMHACVLTRLLVCLGI